MVIDGGGGQDTSFHAADLLSLQVEGDYYAAGFLYGLTCGYSLEKCSIIGSILASNVIQVVGTTLSKKKWDEIKLNIEALLQA